MQTKPLFFPSAVLKPLVVVCLSSIFVAGCGAQEIQSPAGDGVSNLTNAAPTAVIPVDANALSSSTSTVYKFVVDQNSQIGTVPASFLGFSHELSGVFPFNSNQNSPVHTSYLQLIANLTQYKNGPLIIRNGGNTQDATSTTYRKTLLTQIGQLSQQSNVLMTVGIDLLAVNPCMTISQLQGFQAVLSPNAIYAVELGNEPDLYSTSSGVWGTESQYLTNYAQMASAISPYVTKPLLIGPSWASAKSSALTQDFLNSQQGNIKMLSAHFYTGNGQDSNWSTTQLLTESSAKAPLIKAAPMVATAHASQTKFRFDEFGSLYNGGASGVSDSFASALWLLDVSLRLAQAGIDGINLHGGWTLPYSPIQEINSSTGRDPQVMPQYYAMLIFNYITRGLNASFLSVSSQTNENILAYVLKHDDNSISAVVINKSGTASGTISLSGFDTRQSAVLSYLSAPSIGAQNGITYGGQTFDNTPDGKAVGNLSTRSLVVGSDGSLVFSLTPYQVGVVDLPAP